MFCCVSVLHGAMITPHSPLDSPNRTPRANMDQQTLNGSAENNEDGNELGEEDGDAS